MRPAIEDRQLTASEAAAAFGVPRRTMYRWIDEAGLVPATELASAGAQGVTRFFRLGDLARVVADGRATRRPERSTAETRLNSDRVAQ